MVVFYVATIGRVGYISFNKSYTASSEHNSIALDIEKQLPTIYYRNNEKATNNTYSYIAVIRPNAKCINELQQLFDYKERNEIINELKKGYPVLRSVNEEKQLKYIQLFKVKASDNNLNQLIYKSTNGILNHIDDVVATQKIRFSVDATGRLLDGDNGTLVKENYNTKEGYRISIDKRIQDITINATANMKSGCAIVMNIEDSSILALVNKPDDSYYIKPFQNYSVGSVFKLVVTASALENGLNPTYNCTGSIKVGETVFSCQKKHIHGVETLKSALANSCNCYFVNLANKLGKNKLLKTCKELGFDDKTELFDSWYIQNASLPASADLNIKGELSLFGFGQGKLLVTPLQMCSVICTIANGGVYNSPRLFLTNMNNEGKGTPINYPAGKQVINSSTCTRLIEYMRYVVTDGTGNMAEDKKYKSAGKTATAQTGQYKNGKEMLNTWFAGVYPYDKPKYAIVIMTENGESGSKNCCPIFRTIVEAL